MLTLSVKQTNDEKADINSLNTLLDILRMYPGTEGVHIKVLLDNRKPREFPKAEKVDLDADFLDMVYALIGENNVEFS